MEKNKVKLLRVLDILKKTDERNPITTNEIVKKLLSYGIEAERKSVLRDIDTLQFVGYDIILHADNKKGYYMASREFEDWELKVLCDAVASSKCLTAKDKRSIFDRVCNLSGEEGKKLLRKTSVIIDDSLNESNLTKVYIDMIMSAIRDNKKIEFRYVVTNSEMKKEYKRDGLAYTVNPYVMIWKEDKCYLVGSYGEHNDLSCYRIDRIRELVISEDDARVLEDVLGRDARRCLEDYVKKLIYGYSGNRITLTLKTKEYMIDDLIERFGKDIHVENKKDYVLATVNTNLSEGLYFWLLQFGKNVTVISPEEVRDEVIKRLWKIYRNYKEETK